MRDMTDDEKRVFDEKMDYIGKLRDSMTQEEMDVLLPKAIQEKMDTPRFVFGGENLYPRKDFNEYLEASFTGSPASDEIGRLKAERDSLMKTVGDMKVESDGYVSEIERLEADLERVSVELKDAKARVYVGKGDEPLVPETPKSRTVLFHPGELLAFNYSMLNQWMQNHRPQTPSENVRAYQLAKEMRDGMMESFDLKKHEAEAKAFRERLDKAVEECFSTNPTNIAPLLAMGFRDKTRKNSPHWKVTFMGMDDYTFTLSKTPSDSRAVERCKANITQRLCICN